MSDVWNRTLTSSPRAAKRTERSSHEVRPVATIILKNKWSVPSAKGYARRRAHRVFGRKKKKHCLYFIAVACTTSCWFIPSSTKRKTSYFEGRCCCCRGGNFGWRRKLAKSDILDWDSVDLCFVLWWVRWSVLNNTIPSTNKSSHNTHSSEQHSTIFLSKRHLLP